MSSCSVAATVNSNSHCNWSDEHLAFFTIDIVTIFDAQTSFLSTAFLQIPKMTHETLFDFRLSARSAKRNFFFGYQTTSFAHVPSSGI